MKRFVFGAILFTAAAVLFAGGSGETKQSAGTQGQAVKLRFTTWTGDKEQLGLLKSIADEFNASQNTYKTDVSFETVPFQDYVSKITLQLSGSNPPDLGWMVETAAPTFVNSGVLVDLKESLRKYDFPDLNPMALELWSNGGKVYGVPFSTSPFVIFYNKTMIEKAGVPVPSDLAAKGEWTWEAFRKIAKAVKDKTGVYGFQGMDGMTYDKRVWHTLVPLIRSYGADAWDRSGTIGLNSPQAVQAVKFFHEMVYRDKSIVPPGDQSDFYAGNAAMTAGQISRVTKLKDVTWKWDLAPMPTGPTTVSDTIGQAAIVVFGAGKNKEAARELLAYMTNKENVLKMAKYWPPARVSVMKSDAFLKSNPLISPESMQKAVVSGLLQGKVLPSHEKFPQIDLAASAQFDKLWNPSADVQAVMDAVAQAVKASM